MEPYEISDRDSWMKSLTLKLIAEPLRVFDHTEKPRDAFVEMQRENWSEAVFKKETELLYTFSQDHARQAENWSEVEADEIKTTHLVSQDCAIRIALNRIVLQERLFVLSDTGVTHIVTPADLNKQPAQMMAFGIIQDFEKQLLNAIRRELKTETAITSALEKYQDKYNEAFKIHDARKRQGQDLHLSDCLTLPHKYDLARLEKLTQIIECFGTSRNQRDKYINTVTQLRNNLAHGQSTGDLNGGWSCVLETLEKTEKITNQLST